MKQQLRPALAMLAVMSVITGLIYPMATTVFGQLVFPAEASGSLIEREGMIVGSELLGQPFAAPGYFWGRPSATGPFPYNAAASSGSNLGPLNEAQLDAVEARVAALRAADPGNPAAIPVDLVTASASGLDPHISPAAAYYQVPRIAAARDLAEAALRELVGQHVKGRQLGILGEPVVNVLQLNLALDGLE